MKPLNFMPANTSAFHLWSLYLWQCKYEKAVGLALEIMGGEYAFWSKKKKGPLFAKALAVVQHDRTLQFVTSNPELAINKRAFAFKKPVRDIEFSFAIEVKTDRAAALVVTP